MVFQARLDDSPDGAWKMYAVGSPLPSRAVTVQFESLHGAVDYKGIVQQLDAQSRLDPWFDATVTYFERQALLWTDVTVKRGTADGTLGLGGWIEFMVCNDRICLPPARKPFEVALNIRESAPKASLEEQPKYDPSLMPKGATSGL